MNEIARKIKEAEDLSDRYRDAPRAGWIKKGNKSRSNHAILVPRDEATLLANNLASAIYQLYAYIYEVQELQDYISRIAQGERDAVRCPIHQLYYRQSWTGKECPYCAAGKKADDVMAGIMEERA